MGSVMKESFPLLPGCRGVSNLAPSTAPCRGALHTTAQKQWTGIFKVASYKLDLSSLKLCLRFSGILSRQQNTD